MPKYKIHLYNLFRNNNDISTYLALIMLYDQHSAFYIICSNVHFHFSINMNVTNYYLLPTKYYINL